jgi:hypothetical protein
VIDRPAIFNAQFPRHASSKHLRKIDLCQYLGLTPLRKKFAPPCRHILYFYPPSNWVNFIVKGMMIISKNALHLLLAANPILELESANNIPGQLPTHAIQHKVQIPPVHIIRAIQYKKHLFFTIL